MVLTQDETAVESARERSDGVVRGRRQRRRRPPAAAWQELVELGVDVFGRGAK